MIRNIYITGAPRTNKKELARFLDNGMVNHSWVDTKSYKDCGRGQIVVGSPINKLLFDHYFTITEIENWMENVLAKDVLIICYRGGHYMNRLLDIPDEKKRFKYNAHNTLFYTFGMELFNQHLRVILIDVDLPNYIDIVFGQLRNIMRGGTQNAD